MAGKKKNFMFHNPKVIQKIESYPNQSRYLEDLVLQDCHSKPYLQEMLEKFKKELIEAIKEATPYTSYQFSEEENNEDTHNSIFNVLNSVL